MAFNIITFLNLKLCNLVNLSVWLFNISTTYRLLSDQLTVCITVCRILSVNCCTPTPIKLFCQLRPLKKLNETKCKICSVCDFLKRYGMVNYVTWDLLRIEKYTLVPFSVDSFKLLDKLKGGQFKQTYMYLPLSITYH